MAEVKTKTTDVDPRDFLQAVESELKRAEGLSLLEMFEKVTAEKAVMWGSTIVGFGQYHYKSERSTQEADWFLAGFSPRRHSLTLYIMCDDPQFVELLPKLGQYKASVGCLYINKLSDVDESVLASLIQISYTYKKKITA